jgi:hypothetical protein
VGDYLPSLFGALIILVVGWIVALVAVAIVRSIPSTIDSASRRRYGSGMSSVRQPVRQRDSLPQIHLSAPRWLPRVFRNLGRGVF